MKQSTIHTNLDKRLHQLPADADKALEGLVAGPHLKMRIERAAANPAPVKASIPVRRWAPALSLAVVLAVGAIVGLPAVLEREQQTTPLITTQSLGDEVTSNERALLDLGGGEVNISNRANTPEYRSIWAKGSNGSFPMVGVNGAYYRMMTTPSSVSSSLLGASVGSVAEFTTEPSLSGTNVILSNQAAIGTPIYEISGMSGAMVAAEVDGKMRLFQRVGFNGSAIMGRESLADTLDAGGRITAMELSDVGIITDSSVCESLYRTLTSCASYESSGSVSAKQSLLIELDNGLTLQLAVKNDKLGACGTWSCPEFFEEFEAALR